MIHTEPTDDIITCPMCKGKGCDVCDYIGEYKIDYRDLGVKK